MDMRRTDVLRAHYKNLTKEQLIEKCVQLELRHELMASDMRDKEHQLEERHKVLQLQINRYRPWFFWWPARLWRRLTRK